MSTETITASDMSRLDACMENDPYLTWRFIGWMQGEAGHNAHAAALLRKFIASQEARKPAKEGVLI